MSFFDTHPQPNKLLIKNKKYLESSIAELKIHGTDYVKHENYSSMKAHVNIFFKLIRRIYPSAEFEWKKNHIKIFITSFILYDNINFYNISKQSLFFQSLTNHIQAFNEYLMSNTEPLQWLPLWNQFLVDFEAWKEEDRQLVANSLIENYNELRNDIIQQPAHVDTDELIEKSKPLLQKIQERIHKHANDQEKENLNFTPIIHSKETIKKVEDVIKKVFWEKMKVDLQKPVAEWEYSWTLFEDLFYMFNDLVPHSNEAKEHIKQELCPQKWKEYIIRHEVKEHAIKEYLTTVHSLLEFLGIPDHRERYHKCINECIEIVSTLSYPEAITSIFKKLFKECETLFLTANIFRLRLNQRTRK